MKNKIRLVIELSAEARQRLKIYAASKSSTMKKIIVDFIESLTKEK